MYIHYSIGNNSGPRTLVRIVEVTVIGRVRFRRFHCISSMLIVTTNIYEGITCLYKVPYCNFEVHL